MNMLIKSIESIQQKIVHYQQKRKRIKALERTTVIIANRHRRWAATYVAAPFVRDLATTTCRSFVKRGELSKSRELAEA